MSDVLGTVTTYAGVELTLYPSVAYCNGCRVRIALWEDEDELLAHECDERNTR